MAVEFDDDPKLANLINDSVDELSALNDPQNVAGTKRRRQRPAGLGDGGFSDDDAADGDDRDLIGPVDALARGPAAQRPQVFGDGSAGQSTAKQTQLDYDSEKVMERLTGQVAVPDGFEAIGQNAHDQSASGQNILGQPSSAVGPDDTLSDGALLADNDDEPSVGPKNDEPAHEKLSQFIGETINERDDPFNLYRGPKVRGADEDGQFIRVVGPKDKKPAAPATPPKAQPPAAAPPAQTPAQPPATQAKPPAGTQPPAGQSPAQPPGQTPAPQKPQQQQPSAQAPGGNTARGYDPTNLHDKVYTYLFDHDHPDNGGKAKWFKSALGFDQSNWQDFTKQLYFDEKTAIVKRKDQHGTHYDQWIPIRGANGRTINTKFGFTKAPDGTVRFITGIPTDK